MKNDKLKLTIELLKLAALTAIAVLLILDLVK